jgi:hypothetical protein
MSGNTYKVVKFNAKVPVKKEVTVKFRTKTGEVVSFPATKIVKEKGEVKFKSKK